MLDVSISLIFFLISLVVAESKKRKINYFICFVYKIVIQLCFGAYISSLGRLSR